MIDFRFPGASDCQGSIGDKGSRKGTFSSSPRMDVNEDDFRKSIWIGRELLGIRLECSLWHIGQSLRSVSSPLCFLSAPLCFFASLSLSCISPISPISPISSSASLPSPVHLLSPCLCSTDSFDLGPSLVSVANELGSRQKKRYTLVIRVQFEVQPGVARGTYM